MDVWSGALIFLAILVVIHSVILLALLRQVGIVQDQLVTLQTRARSGGSLNTVPKIPDIRLVDIGGSEFNLSDLWDRGPALLAFVSTGCAACTDSLEQLAELTSLERGGAGSLQGLQIAVICSGHLENVAYMREFVRLPNAARVAAVDSSTMQETFGVSTTPTMAIVGDRGYVQSVSIGSGNREDVRAFVSGGKAAVYEHSSVA